MRVKFLTFCFLLVELFSISQLCAQNSKRFSQKNYAGYVNTFIGTGGHGHTYPGATLPFGMVQLSPDTRIDGSWDGCGGYHYSDSVIYGFSHTHLSGTGVSDYGDILLMPTTDVYSVDNKKYASTFSHKNEKANAGFYEVKLNNGVGVELTATTRVGLHRYTFPKNKTANLVLDLTHRDKTLDSYLKITGPNTIEGYRQSEAWASDQRIYFVAEFSKKFDYEAFVNDSSFSKNNKNKLYHGKNVKAIFSFKNNNQPLLVKVAISFVSADGARKNLKKEMPLFHFEQTKLAAQKAWNRELQKIEVTTKDTNKLAIFYTALYHTMIQPNIAMDVDSMYYGMDKKIHKAQGFSYYTVFSLWDTFRATHPLYTIIDKKRTKDFIYTFLEQYKQSGKLPVWEFASNETNCMIGYHAASVIADAATKGIIDFDKSLQHNTVNMLEAMIVSANKRQSIETLNQQFISVDNESESVSKTLEYAYDDWCIAQFASMIDGKLNVHEEYMKRSQNWKNVFDAETGFMRPKKNGNFLSPFDAKEVNNHYTEANSWQYSFFVPHDIGGLIEMHGGAVNFEKKLDDLFTTNSTTTGREQVDITGLIGQYAHGNEPSHHIAYLYNYIGKPYKTQQRVNQIINEFYKNTPDGLIGNEDCGQMSAWYVLSSIGLYNVCPGQNAFTVTTPQFNKIVFNLEDNQKTIIAANTSNKNTYIKKINLNDSTVLSSFVGYVDLFGDKKTNALNFELSETADAMATDDYMKYSSPNNSLFCVAPIIQTNNHIFNDSLLVELKSAKPNDKLYYLLNYTKNLDPNTVFYNNTPGVINYTKPFYIHNSTNIKAFARASFGGYPVTKNANSGMVTAHFYKRPNNWTITYKSTCNPQYNGGGNLSLVDGINGTTNWQKGEWQGYQNQNFECVVDLQTVTDVQSIASNYLQDTRSWILFPTKVEYYTSEDGKNYTLFSETQNGIEANDYSVQTREFGHRNSSIIKARYVKIKAINYGKLPSWHQGFGGDAFIFIDEISIK